MARTSIRVRLARRVNTVGFLTAYDEQGDTEIVVPESFDGMSDDDLAALTTQATEAFDALYGDGSNLSADDLTALASLTEAIESLNAEADRRNAEAQERAEAAAALAQRVRPAEDTATPGEEPASEDESDEDESEDEEGDGDGEQDGETEDQPEAVAASAGRREVRVNLSGLRSRQSRTPAPREGAPETMRDVVFAAPDTGVFANGQGLDMLDIGRAVDHRLTTFNQASYERAAAAGKHIRQQFGVAVIRKPFEDDLRITSSDPEHVERVFARATDESRLPGGSLVASGGWCAPSETLYDLVDYGASREGLFSLPEVGVSRGGIRFTKGPDFATLFSEITGFSYTEAQDVAGTYGVDADGVGDGSAGDKPCYKVDCPDFEEVRLGVDGLCITAGLLQRKGYPEMIANTVRGALVAHDHRIAGRKLAQIVAGSDAVSMAADQVGAVAPILTAIDLQVEHYRDIHRLGRRSTLEAVFPFWVHGAIRSDLSRRLGVDLFDVPDSRINKWFSDRGVNPQFVYNWQGVSNPTGSAPVAAAAAIAWPTEVTFLLYAAGTWAAGGGDVITLDTIYDSVLLGQNDYTALFTEEGTLVAKRGHDSRAVTVPICPDGATAGGVLIACDGSAEAEVAP